MKIFYIASSKNTFYVCRFSDATEIQLGKLCGSINSPIHSVFKDICSYGREWIISRITPMEWDAMFWEPDDDRFTSSYRKECGCDFCKSFAKVAVEVEDILNFVTDLLLKPSSDLVLVLLNDGNQIHTFNSDLWRYNTTKSQL